MGQTIVNGLLIGGVYALVTVGISLIHGVMKIVNFAQGDFLAVGMYVSLIFFATLPSGALPYWLLLPVALIMFLLGAAVFKLTVTRVVGKGDSNYILLTLGLSYLIQNLLQLIFGPDYHSLNIPNYFRYGSFGLFDDNIILMYPRLVAFIGALIFVLLVNYFINSTDLGRAMRATSESSIIAATLGIDTERVFTIAFALGILFAGLAGLLLTPMFLISPQIGTTFSTVAMSAMVLGGLGNLKGAMLGGLLIGLVESLTSNYLSMDLAPVTINAVLMLVLIFRPYGIFGEGGRKA
ncbi:MAG: branched-chain amino acid ABC transporter permease [Limnochordia bacterium]|jgi:branched-chain amino acid transport system permease protein